MERTIEKKQCSIAERRWHAQGQLAEQTGLTTGAITGVVDRLEKAGLVKRGRDTADRRRVILELLRNPAHEQLLQQLYGPMGIAIAHLVEQYGEKDRAVILDFLTKATAVLENATLELRQGAKEQGGL